MGICQIVGGCKEREVRGALAVSKLTCLWRGTRTLSCEFYLRARSSHSIRGLDMSGNWPIKWTTAPSGCCVVVGLQH